VGKTNMLQARGTALQNVILFSLTLSAAIAALVLKAPDKWLGAIYETVVTFGGMICFFRLRWRYRRFWLIVVSAFSVHLALTWVVFAVLLQDRKDISLAVCVPFILFEATALYFCVRALEPKLPGLPTRVVKKGF
jgi:hypothetical protein